MSGVEDFQFCKPLSLLILGTEVMPLFNSKHLSEHIYMRPKRNSNLFEISLRDKFHFGVRQLHYQRTHDFGWSETHFGANFTSVKLTEVKLQTAVSFPCKQ